MAEYTDEQKAEAVRLYLEHGAEHAAEVTGCHRTTIYRWLGTHATSVADEKRQQRHAETLARHQAKRAQIRELLLDQAIDALVRMREPHYDYRGKDVIRVDFEHAPSGAVKDYATAAAILIDKYRLEMGEPTGRTHSQVDVSDSSIDREVEKLASEMKRRFETEAAEPSE